MTVMTELSGNDFSCLAQKNYTPANIVTGNSVRSLGLSDKIESSLTGMLGKELIPLTKKLNDSRQNAYQRMMQEATALNASGVIGVNSKLLFHGNNLESIFSGSTVNAKNQAKKMPLFSTSVDGKQFYALLDAEYLPVSFVFGNVAYATAITGGIMGKLSTFKQGEVKNLSDTFNQTRQLALARIIDRAREHKADAIIDIKAMTQIFTGANEMLMTGTAIEHRLFADSTMRTSTLSADEIWNLARLGYAPRQLLLGTSIFSVGLIRNFSNMLKSIYQNEIPELTDLFNQARKNALTIIDSGAKAIHAETVIGMKTHIYHLGNGLIECLIIGTAIEQLSGIKTESLTLPVELYSRM
jgi:uncharacterized protein YbjQ (UPF0145 family)